MNKTTNKYSPEVRERSVRMVLLIRPARHGNARIPFRWCQLSDRGNRGKRLYDDPF